MTALIPGYRLGRQIGTGAGSRIYRATHVDSGREYAVKRVARRSSDDDRFVEQLENEFAISSKVRHPHLRHSHEIHRRRKLLQLQEVLVVLEFVDGLGFERAAPNRLDHCLTVFRKIVGGLHALHKAGYVHADMKPNNVLLGRRGVVKIIDFGQACPIGHRKERIQGTPDFIAPEQVRRLPLDERTDIFNVGATMYWALTAENYPTEMQGADPRGGIKLIQRDRPITPIEWNEKIPPALSKLVMECCSSSPADRPADMQQLSARLVVLQKLWRKHLHTARAGQRESADVPVGPSSAKARKRS